MGFIKAPHGAITRYLWVGGVHGMSVRQLIELFAPYGSPAVVLPEVPPAAPLPPVAAPPSAAAEPQNTCPPSSPPRPHSELLQPVGLELHALHAADVPEQQPQQPQQRPSSPSSQPMPHYHAFLSFEAEGDAAAAMAAVPRSAPWPAAGGRQLVLHFADVRRDRRPVPRPVATSADGLGVPGLALIAEFVTPEEEEALLAAVGAEPRGAEAPLAEEGARVPSGSGWEAMARRRVQHYGYRFDYAARNVDLVRPLGPLPPWAAGLAERVGALPQVSQQLDQLTVNEYEPGVGLAPHVDTHSAFTGPIIALSLGSPVVMELRRGGVARPLLLPRRSLLVMGGESRYAWQHYIPHRVADLVDGVLVPRSLRVSLTFRKARGFPCDCSYPDCCDSQQAKLPPTRISQLQQPEPDGGRVVGPGGGVAAAAEGAAPSGGPADAAVDAAGGGDSRTGVAATRGGGTTTANGGGGGGNGGTGGGGGGGGGNGGAGGGGGGSGAGEDEEARLEALEAEYVHKVYEAIAPHFSSTRFAIWPRVRAFIESLPRGGMVADVGCGNGKYFGVRRDLAVLGSDISAGLAAVAAQRLHPPGLPPSASPPAADALMADALRLPYRPASCDGALCIAVLHHLSSRRRRVRLLRQLLRVLCPGGGRALVTVWATEQEDPAKTLAKWTPIPAPDGGGGAAAAASECLSTPADADAESGTEDERGGVAAAGGGGGGAEVAVGGSGSAVGGGDYFVPWHLPFHRTEAAKATKEAKQAEEQERAGGEAGGTADGSSAGGGRRAGGKRGPTGAAPKIDPAKGAVVFQRYYHLFEKEELVELVEEALAEGPAAGGGGGGADGRRGSDSGSEGGGGDGSGGAPCGVVEEVFYDRSNWCIVFRRDR